MTNKRQNPKRDANEREIIELAECLGCSVRQLNGSGIPDLLLGFRHLQTGQALNLLVECKNGPNKSLTSDQIVFFETWQGQCVVLHSLEEAEGYLKGAMGYFDTTP